MKPVRAFTRYSFKIHFDSILQFSPSCFRSKIFYMFHVFQAYYILAYFILLRVIILIIFVEKHKL
jgi:hypothetical protein